MSERITHEEALRALDAGHSWERDDTLRAYVNQQRAAEADTISRAELEKAIDWEVKRVAAARDARLTALQAELATERARAEEAEEAIAVLEPQVERLTREHLRLGSELAAANARAAELEAELRIAWEDEPASPPPAASIEAGRVQTSPFQQVAEASVQPAPGGVERWVPQIGDVVRGSARKPRGCYEGSGVIVEVITHSTLPIHVKWNNGSRGNYAQVELERMADPTPADHTRPDYVTYDVLIEALRESHYDGLANRLEKARKS